MYSEIWTIAWKYLIIPILIYVSNYVVAYFKAKIDEIATKADDELEKKIIMEANELVSTCVLATTQTYVDALKKAGAFDKDAQKEALRITTEAVYSLMTNEMSGYIECCYGDVETYITNLIEAKIAENKKMGQ